MKYIKGFEGRHSVTADGRIYSHLTKKFLKHYDSKLGYRYFSFKFQGRMYSKTIHRMVAIAFIPNPHNKPEVNRIDGNKLNNHVSNLEWATRSENGLHAFRIGLKSKKGEKATGSKLTEEKVHNIRHMRASGVSNRTLATLYNMDIGSIRQVYVGKSWSHVPQHSTYTKQTTEQKEMA